jgi:hypothetical protein
MRHRFVAVLALVTSIAAPIARADERPMSEPPASTEEQVELPAPEDQAIEEKVEEQTAPQPLGDQPPPESGVPGYATAEPPIPALHRPGGIWGPLAIAADVLVMRPIGFISLAAGGAAFVVVSPIAAATQTLGDRVDALEDRAHDVFTRPLGAL